MIRNTIDFLKPTLLIAGNLLTIAVLATQAVIR